MFASCSCTRVSAEWIQENTIVASTFGSACDLQAAHSPIGQAWIWTMQASGSTELSCLMCPGKVIQRWTLYAVQRRTGTQPLECLISSQDVSRRLKSLRGEAANWAFCKVVGQNAHRLPSCHQGCMLCNATPRP